MLIEAILNSTDPDHPDFEGLSSCLETVREVAETINSKMKKHEELDLILDIQRRFDKTIAFETLFKPFRHFKFEIELWKQSPVNDTDYEWPSTDAVNDHRVCVLLFNDIIILATYNKYANLILNI